MRAEAKKVTEASANGTPIPKVQFIFTVPLAQLRRMTPEEVTDQIASMSRHHVAGAVAHAHRDAGGVR